MTTVIDDKIAQYREIQGSKCDHLKLSVQAWCSLVHLPYLMLYLLHRIARSLYSENKLSFSIQ